MVGEVDAEHVEHLALHPVGRLPDAADAGHLGAVGDGDLEPQARLVVVAVQPVDDVETAALALRPVDGGQVHQVAVAELVLAGPAHLKQSLEGDHRGHLTGELDGLDDGSGGDRLELGNLRMLHRILGLRGDRLLLPRRLGLGRRRRCRGVLLAHCLLQARRGGFRVGSREFRVSSARPPTTRANLLGSA